VFKRRYILKKRFIYVYLWCLIIPTTALLWYSSFIAFPAHTPKTLPVFWQYGTAGDASPELTSYWPLLYSVKRTTNGYESGVKPEKYVKQIGYGYLLLEQSWHQPIILEVIPDSPAHIAGLKKGDIVNVITEDDSNVTLRVNPINNRDTNNTLSLQKSVITVPEDLITQQNNIINSTFGATFDKDRIDEPSYINARFNDLLQDATYLVTRSWYGPIFITLAWMFIQLLTLLVVWLFVFKTSWSTWRAFVRIPTILVLTPILIAGFTYLFSFVEVFGFLATVNYDWGMSGGFFSLGSELHFFEGAAILILSNLIITVIAYMASRTVVDSSFENITNNNKLERTN
jgi:hypothetical protein